MKPGLPDETKSDFDAETARFRAILSKGRSAIQLELFDLLVERSNDLRSPKEIEIASALFYNVEAFDAGGVRVYVHRLRKRMNEHYQGKAGPRLVIPKGEYRIVLEADNRSTVPERLPLRVYRWLAINPALSFGLALVAFAGLAFTSWSIIQPSRSEPTIGPASAGQALLRAPAGSFNPLIVVGDNMLLAETEDQRSIQRMILNPAIRSRDDFGTYLKSHPETFYRLYDFNLHFASIGAAEAAWGVQGKLVTENAGLTVEMTPVSALDADQLKSYDVVFVGRLSQLGVLESPVFAQSHLRLAAYDQLIDATNGSKFEARVYPDDPTRPDVDIGYLAIRNGPTGGRLIVLAGLGDRGTAAMVALLDTPQDLAALRRRLGATRNFEAVFKVLTLPGQSPERRLVATWPLP